MKTTTILILALLLSIAGFSQKKSGTVYLEHKHIDIVNIYWQNYFDLDKETLMDITADTIRIISNGVLSQFSQEKLAWNFGYWAAFENLKVQTYPGYYADAIEYKDGFNIVQDWLLFTGTHRVSGINLNLLMHNIYFFNEDDNIFQITRYFNNDVFEEITKSSKTIKNGIVYSHHPHINTVRKVLNDYIAMDVEAWEKYFTPNAVFLLNTNKPEDFLSLDERKKGLSNIFSSREKIIFKQIGYPDCIYYEKGNVYHVLSWWAVTDINKDGEKHEFTIALTHCFNKDGKIIWESAHFNGKK